MSLGKISIQTGTVGPGAFPEREGVALFIGTCTTGEGVATPVGTGSDFATLFGTGNLVDALNAARSNSSSRWKGWAIGTVNRAATLDNGPAVDKGGGKVGLPATAHGLPAGHTATIAGTTNYNGAVLIDEDTTDDEIVIVAAFQAETFAGTETATVDEDWEDVIDTGLAAITPELIVVCKPITAAAELTTMSVRAATLLAAHKRVLFLATFRGITAASEDWADYVTAAAAVTSGLAAPRVMLRPQLFGTEPGDLAGRLAQFAFETKINRSPMRVKSGAILGVSAKPVDMSGVELDIATLEALDTARFSVSQWYEGRVGIYFADALMLGGPNAVAEHDRIADKAASRIYLTAVANIADDLVQNTPDGNATFATALGAPLRAMAQAGEIKPLVKDAITITWSSLTKVSIHFKVQPPNAPKDIEGFIELDTTTP